MKRLSLFAALLVVFSSVLGLSSAQSPASPDPLFGQLGSPSLPTGTVLIEGDIIIPVEHLHTRGTYQTWQWPGSVVYYEFAPYISPANRDAMRASMDILESISDVSFQLRPASQPNYIYIIEDNANYSYVGMVRGRQELSIYNWEEPYVIVHELMHALGIWHEQSRSDRDAYITVNYDNIWPGYESNFDTRQGSTTYGPYDFCSLMHYGPLDFSMSGLPTISPNPGYEVAAACMGNRTSMTADDEATVALLYDLSGEIPGERPATAIEIVGGEFTFSAPSSDFGISADEPPFACSSGLMPVTNTVWFEITPDNARYVDIYTGGYDTVVGVFTGNLSNLFLEACADYYGTGIDEWIGLPLEQGITYYIGVGSWVGSAGLLNFTTYSYRNIVLNGSFDWATTDWKRMAVPSTRTDDKRKCGRIGFFNSLCALKLKGGVGENTTFNQTRTFSGDWPFSAGDTLWLSAMYYSNSAKNKVKVTAKIVYENGTKQKLPALTAVGSTYGYSEYGYQSAVLDRSDVKKVVVKVNNKSTGGKTLVDNIALTGDFGVSLRGTRARAAVPTKPQTLAPVANKRGASSDLLSVPPPAN